MRLPSGWEPWVIAALPRVVRGLAATWSVRVEGAAHLGLHLPREDVAGRRRIFALWHGRQLGAVAALGVARRLSPLVALVSASRDGQIQRPVLEALGIGSVTGSTSRYGAGGLRDLAAAVRGGASALLAVDGPSGPPFCARSGAAALARMTGVPITPVGVEAWPRWELDSTWDGFWIPAPGAQVVVRFGPPLPAPPRRADLADTLDAAQRALAALNSTQPTSLRGAR